jgi:hypothetical protein
MKRNRSANGLTDEHQGRYAAKEESLRDEWIGLVGNRKNGSLSRRHCFRFRASGLATV